MVSRFLWLILLFGLITPTSIAHNAPLYTYDLTPVWQYDLKTNSGARANWSETHLVAALQGLVNRKVPQLYVYAVSEDAGQPGAIDRFWLTEIQAPGQWLTKRPLKPILHLEDLVNTFRHDVKGVVLYDYAVPATSNVASTVAGCDDLLPIPYDPAPGSVYSRLVIHGPHLPVKVSLIRDNGQSLFDGSHTGSAKDDAYLWAKEHYLDTGKCSSGVMAYCLDAWWLNFPDRGAPNAHSLTNHDYFIAHRAFFFDLSPWEDEVPQDAPTQPLGADHRTLLAILRSAYHQTRGRAMIHVGGFIPWAWKYTETAGGRHGDVATEWHYAAILSCFNAYMDADALGLNAMANASVFQHFPLKKSYPQHKPTLADWQREGYVDKHGHVVPRTYLSLYVGDYDSAAWLYHRLPQYWSDPARGQVPLSWAFDPNLAARFPVGLAWARSTKTDQDFFIAGDSGAGYLNPGNLDGDRPFSHLPSGRDLWAQHCMKYYRQWDISLTGFVIDGESSPMSAPMLRAYAGFSPDGIVGQKLPTSQGLVPGTSTPYLTMGDDLPNGDQIDEAMVRIQSRLAQDSNTGPYFHVFRTVLWSPTQQQALFRRLQGLPNVTIVDAYTLMGLLRLHLQNAIPTAY